MDEVELIFSQVEKFRKFDAFRIVDPLTNMIIKEKCFTERNFQFPNYNISQTINFYKQCYSSTKPVLNITYQEGSIFLLLIVPVKIDNKELMSELLIDINDNIYLDEINLNDKDALFREIGRLRKSAITDQLTGLYNRRYLEETLPIEILTCAKQEQSLSIIFSDLDHFKNVNDTYGHAAGDFILCEFAKILSKNIRKDKDWIARYGGEEFILFLVNVDNKTAKEIAERIRIAIMNKSFDFHGQVIKLTCSFGVHTVNSFKTIPSTLEILDAVDKRLYRAKSMGRNMVVT